jgi:hypothetical protein
MKAINVHKIVKNAFVKDVYFTAVHQPTLLHLSVLVNVKYITLPLAIFHGVPSIACVYTYFRTYSSCPCTCNYDTIMMFMT